MEKSAGFYFFRLFKKEKMIGILLTILGIISFVSSLFIKDAKYFEDGILYLLGFFLIVIGFAIGLGQGFQCN